MKLRIGEYTNIDSIECRIEVDRYEVPIPESEKQCRLCYDISENVQLDGFKVDQDRKAFCKSFYLRDLTNAFKIKTKALKQGFEFSLFEIESKMGATYTIATESSEVASKLEMIEVNQSWFVKNIDPYELDKIWEERSSSDLGLPLPTGLDLYKEIDLN